jgi:hypothetical protein
MSASVHCERSCPPTGFQVVTEPSSQVLLTETPTANGVFKQDPGETSLAWEGLEEMARREHMVRCGDGRWREGQEWVWV